MLTRLFLVAVAASLALGTSTAHAEQSTVSIERVPATHELRATIEISLSGHEAELGTKCGAEGEYEADKCAWLGEASEYPAQEECPFMFDASRGIWVGNVEDGEYASGLITFTPRETRGSIRFCLYAATGIGEPVPVGESTFALSRRPSKTSVYVTVHGCRVKLHVLVNGHENIDGKSTWTLADAHEHVTTTTPTGSAFSSLRSQTVAR